MQLKSNSLNIVKVTGSIRERPQTKRGNKISKTCTRHNIHNRRQSAAATSSAFCAVNNEHITMTRTANVFIMSNELYNDIYANTFEMLCVCMLVRIVEFFKPVTYRTGMTINNQRKKTADKQRYHSSRTCCDAKLAHVMCCVVVRKKIQLTQNGAVKGKTPCKFFRRQFNTGNNAYETKRRDIDT